jgi:hypothetical protein
MCDPKQITSYTTVICGLISAFCWLTSVYVTAKPNNQPDNDGWTRSAYIDENGNDVARALKRQSKWNMWAAIFASIAAIAQAINNYL